MQSEEKTDLTTKEKKAKEANENFKNKCKEHKKEILIN